MKIIYNRLKEAIKKSKKSQKLIAAKFGWAESTLSKIVKGEVDPGVSKIEKIANYLNINYTWLFTGRGHMFYENNEYHTVQEGLRPSQMVTDNNLQYETFNHDTADEFTQLALEAIREEKISQEELVAVVREVRRRRRQQVSGKQETNTAAPVPVPELKK